MSTILQVAVTLIKLYKSNKTLEKKGSAIIRQCVAIEGELGESWCCSAEIWRRSTQKVHGLTRFGCLLVRFTQFRRKMAVTMLSVCCHGVRRASKGRRGGQSLPQHSMAFEEGAQYGFDCSCICICVCFGPFGVRLTSQVRASGERPAPVPEFFGWGNVQMLGSNDFESALKEHKTNIHEAMVMLTASIGTENMVRQGGRRMVEARNCSSQRIAHHGSTPYEYDSIQDDDVGAGCFISSEQSTGTYCIHRHAYRAATSEGGARYAACQRRPEKDQGPVWRYY